MLLARAQSFPLRFQAPGQGKRRPKAHRVPYASQVKARGEMTGDAEGQRVFNTNRETRQAVEYNDTNAIAAVAAKTDDFERQLGLEYDKVLNGLDQIDFSSDDGQQIAATLYTLQQKCEEQKEE